MALEPIWVVSVSAVIWSYARFNIPSKIAFVFSVTTSFNAFTSRTTLANQNLGYYSESEIEPKFLRF